MISAETEDSPITIPAPTNPAWMSPAGTDDHLVEMLISLSGASSQRLEAVRDTAILYYDWEGLADVDRAMAARTYVTDLQGGQRP